MLWTVEKPDRKATINISCIHCFTTHLLKARYEPEIMISIRDKAMNKISSRPQRSSHLGKYYYC